MGAWGVLAFDNDSACDWAYDLENARDLKLVEAALDKVMKSGSNYLDSEDACSALAACEVLARLGGRPGYKNPYTETVDTWVAANHERIRPPAELLDRARKVIDRILGENSELPELWDEGDGEEWRAGVADLRERLGPG